MSNAPQFVYTAHPDATPETEAAALACVYRFVLDCHAKKKAAPESRPDGREESKNDPTAEPEYKR